MLVDIREYVGQKEVEIEVVGLRRACRVDQVEPELWIVGNDHLCYGCDVEFTKKAAKKMAVRLRAFRPEYILTAAAKSLALAYELAKILECEGVAVARKSISPTPPRLIRTPIKSITSQKDEEIMIDGETADKIRGKRVVVFDDTISLGRTMGGLKRLALASGAKLVALAAIWVEGVAPFVVFKKEYSRGELVYLAVFPMFARGKTYQAILAERRLIER